MTDEVGKNKKKWFRFGDAPHFIAIILSVSALAISYLSWTESHRSRLINQSSNRALTYVIDVKVVPKGPKQDPKVSREAEEIPEEELPEGRADALALAKKGDVSDFPKTFKIVVKNIGRTSAKAIGCSYVVVNKSSERSEEHEYDITHGDSVLEELLPGVEEEIIITVPWKPIDVEIWDEVHNSCCYSLDDFYLIGRLTYQDEGTGETYQHRWCFQLGDGTDKLPIKPCPKELRSR
jgi:hypothetical protein